MIAKIEHRGHTITMLRAISLYAGTPHWYSHVRLNDSPRDLYQHHPDMEDAILDACRSIDAYLDGAYAVNY